MKLQTSLNKKNKYITNYWLALSKLLLIKTNEKVDPTHLADLLGYRLKKFAIIHPRTFFAELKQNLVRLELLVRDKRKIIFIVNIQDPLAYTQFSFLCKKKKYLIINEAELSGGFLTTKGNSVSDAVVVGLFLTADSLINLQHETNLLQIPVIIFAAPITPKMWSWSYLSGNFSTSYAQALILAFLKISLTKFSNGTT